MKKLSLLLAVLLLLTACTGAPEPDSTPEPTPTPKPVPQFSNPSGIYADWSKLEKAEAPAEVGTRLSEGPLTTLTPSDDYGLLMPYVGGRVYSADSWGWTETRYGLVTKDGCVVLDPILSSVWTTNTDDGFVYVLNKAPEDAENMENPIELSAICAADGSWCTDFIYSSAYWSGEYLRCYAIDGYGCLMDKDGNIVFELSDIAYEEALSDSYGDYDEWLLQYSGLNYESGYVNMELQDGRCAYFDMEGNILRSDEFDGYCYSRYVFTDGGAAVVDPKDIPLLNIVHGRSGQLILFCTVGLTAQMQLLKRFHVSLFYSAAMYPLQLPGLL